MTTQSNVKLELDELAGKLQAAMSLALELETAPKPGTERHCIGQWDNCQLFRYGKEHVFGDTRPVVLIVYALVNRPVILDLQPGASTVARLLDEGIDVYLLEWGDLPVDKSLSLNDYINGYIDQAIDRVCATRELPQINLLGVCQGGVLSLCYAALHPDKVSRLVTVVTPVDFQTPDNLLSHWAQLVDIDLLVDSLGNIPGSMLTAMFKSLQPGRLLLEKYLDMSGGLEKLEQGERKRRMGLFLAMERWIAESPDQSGEALREFVKGCYQQNLLVKGRFRVAGESINLASLPMPVMNVYARQDHLVPPSASVVLEGLVPAANYHALEIDTGHIGMFVSGRALRQMPTEVAGWLKQELL